MKPDWNTVNGGVASLAIGLVGVLVAWLGFCSESLPLASPGLAICVGVPVAIFFLPLGLFCVIGGIIGGDSS